MIVQEMQASQLDEDLLEPAAVPHTRVPAQAQATQQPQAQPIAVSSSAMPSVPAGELAALECSILCGMLLPSADSSAVLCRLVQPG